MISSHVILPAYNEAENIETCIKTIKAAIGDLPINITVVDNQSTDNTVELAQSLGVEVLTFAEKLTIAELRNRGAAHAKTDFILFIDSDMEVPINWISEFESIQHQTQADVLGFVVGVPNDAPWFAKIWALRTNARRDDLKEVDFLPGHNIAVRRSLFENVNGFRTDLVTSEDKDLVMRLKNAGGRVYSAPPIGIIHWGYEKTYLEWIRKEYWRQSSHMSMIRNHGLKFRLLRFPITSVFHLFGLIILIGAIVLQTWTIALPTLCLLLLPSIAQTLNNKISRRGVNHAIKFIGLYFARFNIAGWAVLSELFRSRKAL